MKRKENTEIGKVKVRKMTKKRNERTGRQTGAGTAKISVAV